MQPTSDATPHTNPFLDPVIMDITPTISAVSDEAPPPSVPTPTAPTSTSLPSSERAVLNSEELLALLLAPDLDESLTPGALLGANNVALFHLLPLILAAVQRVGEQRTLRERFVSLVSVLRMRISACRGLKLRFLLLIGNAGFAQHWDVKLVHRQDCYVSARQALHVTAQDAKTRESSSESLALAHSLTFVEHRDSKRVADWYNDKDQLVLFAARNLFHPREGIHVRNVLWHMRTIRSAFFATELVDGIMERANFQTRGEGVNLAQQLVLHGIIYPVGANKRSFTDDKRRLYQCRIAMQHDDAGHCRVVTSSGNVITNWSDVRSASCNQIRQIGVQIAMDMIDLQSHEFWTRSVYVKGVDKGYRYGYRAITHPLHCIGVNIESHLESNASSAKGNPDIILETAKSNGNGNGNGNGNTEDANTSGSSLLSQSLSTMDINHLRLDSSIVGSVIVRKVFSSIARPMIVELRVPMEDADLTEDDHHLSLSPSVLVKEGDNLMQDLGVEIMFQCFNYVWAHSPRFPKPEQVPMSISYEVFPTSPTQGFMEAVTGLSSMKEYDWNTWMNRYGKDPYRVMEMMRSVAGSYVGAYVCGGRDRHFDNVLIKDDEHVLHIDFGFLMGTSPPIDGPRIAISPQMETVFRALKVWDKFVDMFVEAFLALRDVAPTIIRTSVMVFSKAGYEPDQIRSFLRGRFSLNVHEKDKKAADFVRKQIVTSSGDIKTKFKAFSHAHIDPAWYGLLEKGFPPAVAIMKLVDAKEQKAAKKLASSTGSAASHVSAEERINLKI